MVRYLNGVGVLRHLKGIKTGGNRNSIAAGKIGIGKVSQLLNIKKGVEACSNLRDIKAIKQNKVSKLSDILNL